MSIVILKKKKQKVGSGSYDPYCNFGLRYQPQFVFFFVTMVFF